MTYKILTPLWASALATATWAGAVNPVLAGHANPWAEEDDAVREQFHDVNQAKSEGTPGEDEMNGVMTRSAHGKLGTSDNASGLSGGTGQGGGNGTGHGGGEAGNGGGGHGGGNGQGGHGGGGHGSGGGAGNGHGGGRG